MIKIAFTGTQQGMTPAQVKAVGALLDEAKPREVHHGDCIGADVQVHEMAFALTAERHVHPPKNPAKRAWSPMLANFDVMYPEKEYLPRNHDIVDAAEVLIAAPSSAEEELRSGTWATVRYARKQHKHVYIVTPDGSIRHEEPNKIAKRCENLLPKDRWPYWQRCPSDGVNFVRPPAEEEDDQWLCADCTRLAVADDGQVVT